MEYTEFKEELVKSAKKIDVDITEEQAQKLYKYMTILIDWNKKINLTAITQEKDIIYKHFIDSISINKYIKNKTDIIDIGTGAGFPGIPLKILNSKNNFTLVDSLGKRINFLQNVKKDLNLNNINLIHSRVEDLAQIDAYREKFDIVASRAVANLRVLVEYMLPLVKEDGICICMKGPNIEEEIKDAKNAMNILGGKIEKIDFMELPGEMQRNIVIIRKIKNTPNMYPRKAGIPVKQPL